MTKKSIEERIAHHEIHIRILNDRKDKLEGDLNIINKKIIVHTISIIKLQKKIK